MYHVPIEGYSSNVARNQVKPSGKKLGVVGLEPMTSSLEQTSLTTKILFQRNLQTLDHNKPKQTSIFDLNHMPLLGLAGPEKGLAKLIEHPELSQVLWRSSLHLTHNVSHMCSVLWPKSVAVT